VKHESINAAWRGFYSYWGPHAASTIQHYWRAYRARQQYLQLHAAAVVLQAACRGHLLRASSSNVLRLHREEQRQQQLELEKQQQREQQHLEREARERQQQQERLQEQRERTVQQQRQTDAAVVLQSAVRGWAARQLLEDLAAAAAAAAAAVQAVSSAAVLDEGGSAEDDMSAVPSTCSRASDSTDSCSNSRGSSRQSHSRGSTQSACSLDAPAAAAAAVAACTDMDGMQQEWQEQAAFCKEQQQQYSLPGLVIRHAAEARTASHGGDSLPAGSDCREDLARQLVQRAGQLGVVEGMQAAQLATRALMASSSSRQLQSAMQAVRAARPTM
jgi:myosin heavy subunit